jgi:hypothetical protein
VTAKNERKTAERIEIYQGKADLLATWETLPDEVQIKNHDYIIRLRKEVRQQRAYILHRANADANI